MNLRHIGKSEGISTPFEHRENTCWLLVKHLIFSGSFDSGIRPLCGIRMTAFLVKKITQNILFWVIALSAVKLS
jgi:hypothetical protein